MGDSYEELEPLFDYRRVQPVTFVNLEDDSDSDSDSSPSVLPKRRKTSTNDKNKEENNSDKWKSVQVINCEDEDEEKENLLPPPPKNVAPSKIFEDSTIKQLRLKKQECASFLQSTGQALQAADEPFPSLSHSVEEETAKEAPKPAAAADRTKIVISMQDKAGSKQYRIFADEKFEQLFTKYAQKVKTDVHNLAFTFDGDKIDPASTPQTLGMEDDDLIEVHVKAS